MALSNKQRVFVEEYLACWNATEAARRAGYAHANVQGSQLLANLSIKEAIQARIAEKAMTADEVLLRLADHARSTMADFVNDAGDLDLRAAKQKGKLHLVKTYAVTDKSERIELYDAQAALVHLGRHHGLFVDRQEVSGWVGVTVDDYIAAKQRAANRHKAADDGSNSG